MSIADDVYTYCDKTEQAFRVAQVLAKISYCNGLLKAEFKDKSILFFNNVSCQGFSYLIYNGEVESL